MSNNKHYLVTVQIRNGEYEMGSQYLIEDAATLIDAETRAIECERRDSDSEIENCQYHGISCEDCSGEFHYSIYQSKEVSDAELPVLQKFIN
jgi:Zn finger protein HypA/HybF involved in hydrogenase expression